MGGGGSMLCHFEAQSHAWTQELVDGDCEIAQIFVQLHACYSLLLPTPLPPLLLLLLLLLVLIHN